MNNNFDPESVIVYRVMITDEGNDKGERDFVSLADYEELLKGFNWLLAICQQSEVVQEQVRKEIERRGRANA